MLNNSEFDRWQLYQCLKVFSDKLGGFETRPYISIRKYFQEPV